MSISSYIVRLGIAGAVGLVFLASGSPSAADNTAPAAQPPATPTAPPAQPGAVPAVPAAPEVKPGAVTDPAKPGEGPQIVFDTPVYEFGKMMAGNPIRHDFWFTNRGNKPLEVSAVRPSCGCTTAGSWDRNVEPGKTGKIPILLKTDKVTGAIQKTIKVTTNVPGQNEVTLWIKGEVWQAIDIKPPFVSFRSLADNKEATETVTITNRLDEPLELKNVKSDNPAFRAELKPVTPGKEYTLAITAMPPFKVGPNRAQVTIDTNRPEKPSLAVTASAYVAAAVEVNPRRLILPSSASPVEVERAVYVTSNSPDPLKVTDVKVNNDKITTKLMEDTPGKRFRIILKIPASFDMVEAGKGLELSFKTSHASFPTMSVPIEAVAVRTPTTPQTPVATKQPITVKPAGQQPPAAGEGAKPPQAIESAKKTAGNVAVPVSDGKGK